MKLKISKFTLQIGISLALMLIAAILILVLAASIYSRVVIEDYLFKHVYAAHKGTDQSINSELDDISLLISRMNKDSDFALAVQSAETYEERAGYFRGAALRAGVNSEIINDIKLITEDAEFTLNGDAGLPAPDSAFVKEVLESELPVTGRLSYDLSGEPNILLGRKNYDLASGKDVCLCFYLKASVIAGYAEVIDGTLGWSFLADGRYVLYHPDGEFMGAVIFDAEVYNPDKASGHSVVTIGGERYIVVSTRLDAVYERYGMDFRMVSNIYYDKLFNDILNINIFIIVLGVSLMVLAVFLAVRLAAGISRPVLSLYGKLKEFRAGRVPLKEKYVNDEVKELEEAYNEMMAHISDLIDMNRQEVDKQRKLELYALQMQINPHLLYNTLDAIAWMAKLKEQRDIEMLVMALAKFFRLGLHKGDKYITVAEECEIVRNFLMIESIRFRNKFTFSFEADEAIKDELVLKLIIQPLVENALKHGIAGMKREGKITIRTESAGDDIIYKVTDNGAGFVPPPDLLTRESDQSSLSGYGLRNVDERIKLEYGREYGLSIESEIGKGTTVTARLGKRRI